MTQFNGHSEPASDPTPPQENFGAEHCGLGRRLRLDKEEFSSSAGFVRTDIESLSLINQIGIEGVLAVGLLQGIYFKRQISEGGYKLLSSHNDRSSYSVDSDKNPEKADLSRVSLNLAYIGTEYGLSQFSWAWAKNCRTERQPPLNTYQGKVVDKLSEWAEKASDIGQPFFNDRVMQKITQTSGKSVGEQAAAALLGVNPTGTFLGLTLRRENAERVHYYLIERNLLASPGEPGYFSNIHSEGNRQIILQLLKDQNLTVSSALLERAEEELKDPDYADSVSVKISDAQIRIGLALLELVRRRNLGEADSVA